MLSFKVLEKVKDCPWVATQVNWALVHKNVTQSFPLQLDNYPETTGKMAQYGAYGADKIYTKDQVKELITFATKRGDLFAHYLLLFDFINLLLLPKWIDTF